MAMTKCCPVCGGVLRLYEVPYGTDGTPLLLATEPLTWIAFAVIFGVLGFLGYAGPTRTLAAYLLAIVAVCLALWKPLSRLVKRQEAKRGRLYCESCRQRFEGDGLRPLSPNDTAA